MYGNRGDDPASYHVWTQKKTDTPPMPLDIAGWQLDAHREALYPCDDSSELLSDIVFPTPFVDRIEDWGSFGTKDDARESCEGRFRKVSSVADELREQGVQNQEEREKEVGQMRGAGFDLRPGHVSDRSCPAQNEASSHQFSHALRLQHSEANKGYMSSLADYEAFELIFSPRGFL